MLARLLELVSSRIQDQEIQYTRLPEHHPLIIFIQNNCNNLKDYLELDDAILTSALPTLAQSDDPHISELASRIRHRNLFKCFDVGARSDLAGGDTRARFRRLLNEAKAKDEFNAEIDVLEDTTSVSPYKLHEFESKGALEKILIRRPGGDGRPEDVAKLSPVVDALGEKKVFRVYARNEAVSKLVRDLWLRVT